MDAKLVLITGVCLAPICCAQGLDEAVAPATFVRPPANASPKLQPSPKLPSLRPTPAPAAARPAQPVGAPLPSLTRGPKQPPQPVAPAPPRLLVPRALPPTQTDHGTDDALARAFDVEGLSLAMTPRPANDGVVFVSDAAVRLASAESAVLAPELAQTLAEVEELAGRATAIGDLNDVIERCRAPGRSDKYKVRHSRLAKAASWAFNRRGEVRSDRGEEHAAYEDFDQAIKIDPANAAALHNRGCTLAAYGRHDAALVDFGRAITLGHDPAVAYANRGELLLSIGRLNQAEADFTEALKAEPDRVACLAGRASALQGQGRVAEAVRDLNQAIAIDPQCAESYAGRGALYAAAGYFEQAIADFDAALLHDAECVAAYKSFAWLLATCHDADFRDPTKAVECARRALRLGDAGDPMLLDAAAAAHAAAGDFAQAVKLQQQASLVASPQLREEFDKRHELYRAGKTYTQSD
ncbi:MAG: tetratricopeptide repeat protein [Planctomycetota bacterium]